MPVVENRKKTVMMTIKFVFTIGEKMRVVVMFFSVLYNRIMLL